MHEHFERERDVAEERPALLLVDDDGEFLAAMREQLDELTRHVYIARSPLEALWLLHHLDVDAVVSDLVLGANDGLDLLGRIRAERPGVMRILLTGFSEVAANHAALAVAHAVIHKPTDAASLIALLRWLPANVDDHAHEHDAPVPLVVEHDLHATLGPEVNEHSDLSALAQSTGDLVLNLANVRSINSSGGRELIRLVAHLDDHQVIVAHRCSPAIVGQLNLLPMVAQRLLVRSVVTPMECQECLCIRDVVVEVVPGERPRLPDVACKQCGQRMELADIPERYFAFLDSH